MRVVTRGKAPACRPGCRATATAKSPSGSAIPQTSDIDIHDREVAEGHAGVLLPAVLAERRGIEALVDRMVDLGDRPGAANPGRKVMSLVSAMALGADCIDDCDVLRCGQTQAVLGHAVAAPSTLGRFLRAFTFGHVRQLDRGVHQGLGGGGGQLAARAGIRRWRRRRGQR